MTPTKIICECTHCTRFSGYMRKDLDGNPFDNLKTFQVRRFDAEIGAALFAVFVSLQLVGLLVHLADKRAVHRGAADYWNC